MKKFFVVLFFSVFILSYSPFTVEASQNLVTTDSAIAVSLYSELKNSGYDITVPYPDSDSFQYVMQPLVDAVLDLGEGVVDAFAYLGENLYYDVNKVRGWISSLFGSGDTGSFSVNSSDLVVPYTTFNSYLQNLDGFTTPYQNAGYPFLYNPDNGVYYSPLVCAYDYAYDSWRYSRFRFVSVSGGFLGSVSFNSINGGYNFKFNIMGFDYIRPMWLHTLNGDLNQVTLNYSSSRDFYLNYVRFKSDTSIDNFDFVLSNNTYNLLSKDIFSYDLEVAFRQYLDYLRLYLHNMSLKINFNGNDYFVSPSSYSVSRPSDFVPSTNQTYRPITYQYVTQNFGSADTIYNNYYSGSESGSINTDDIIAAINRVDSSVATGAAAIVSAIQGLEFLSETNNSIVNNYDFHLGDLNISAGITSAANEVDSAFSDLTSGENGGVAKIGADFISVVPSDIAVVLFGIIGASIIALVINKMRS